ncbi:hypothetical protein ACFSQ3_01260 [Sphingobacterium corticis]|uniref:CCDC81-like prokaryotic HU domain-containing protein n=1 Tax=Sphingobacterium corticis TaxID=1812823 RepID=A0ABW5NI44_9SPHI
MELGKKIQQVLKHYPTVSVEGLGVFRKVHQSASFDEARNVFLPPIDYIEFEHAGQGGINIIDYLQQENEITHSAAEELVSQEVSRINTSIVENGKARITQLGDLLKYGDAFVFRPLDLSSFVFEPISNVEIPPYSDAVSKTETSSEEIEPNASTNRYSEENVSSESGSKPGEALEQQLDQDQAASNVSIESNKQHIPVPEAPPLTQNRNQHVGDNQMSPLEPLEENYPYSDGYEDEDGKSNTIWYIVAAIVALSIIGGLWYATRPTSLYSDDSFGDIGNDSTEVYSQQEELALPPADLADIDTSELLKNRQQDTVATSIAQESQENAQAPIVQNANQPIIPANHNWYIVIGSRLPLADAKTLVSDYNKKGQSRVRLIPGRGENSPATVIWDSYVTKEQADSALRHVRKNFVADAWHRAVKK